MKTPILASLILLTSLSPLLTGCGKDAQSAAPAAQEQKKIDAVPVEVAAVEQGDITATYTGTATLEAEREAKVVSEIGGVVLALNAEEGQFVRKGQILARLDGEKHAVMVRQAEAELERLRHNDVRNESLFARQLIAKNLYEQNKSDLASRKAEVDLARLSLSKCAVVAPFDGVVTRRWIKEGQLLKANDVAFEIANFSDLKARLRVPERASVALKPGQKVEYRADALPGRRFAATVDRVSPVVDAKSGTVEILVKVDNSDNSLRPGLFSRLEIAYDHVAAAILLPKAALLSGEHENSVFVVRDGKAVKVPVKLGYESGNNVQVLAGLAPGAEVITAGHASLVDGSVVEALKRAVVDAVAKNVPKI